MNAKLELLRVLNGKLPICASLSTDDFYDNLRQTYILKQGYTQKDWEQFLKSIDFNYDNGYGGQVLFGTVWLPDNEWLTRGEYDGSEWWEFHKYPAIPEEYIN